MRAYSPRESHTPFLRKTTAFFLLICFTYAQLQTGALQAQDSHSLAAHQAIPDFLPSLSLPSELGTVQEIYTAKESKASVILVQDAHAIPDAQKSIRKIVEYFQTHYDVGLVALEGAPAKLDPTLLRNFPDREKLEKVFQGYLDAGEISGAAAAAVLSEKEARYYGIEERGIYEEIITVFLNADDRAPAVSKKLSTLRTTLEESKKQVYSPELLALDRKIRGYEEDAKNLIELLRHLMSMKLGDGFKKYPHLSAIASALNEEENSSDDADLRQEVQTFAKRLRVTLERHDETKAFYSKLQDYKTERTSPRAFAHYLLTLAEEKGIETSLSARLQNEIEKESRLRGLQGTEVFRELHACLEEVKNNLYRNGDERELARRDWELHLLEKLVQLKLTREEWSELKAGERYPAPFDLWPFIRFYELAIQRDGIFFERLNRLMESQSAKTALVVAGGFHTEGLAGRFKKENISYAVLSPRMDTLPSDDRYLEFMRGNVSWKKYFEVENGRINLYEAFHRATIDKLLEMESGSAGLKSGLLLKSWRDQVLRDLSAHKKLETARRYTQFLDEAAIKRMNPSEFETLKKEWLQKVENFVSGLKQLKAGNQLTPENIVKLTNRPAAANPTAAMGLVPGITFPVWRRQEMRTMEAVTPELWKQMRDEMRELSPWYKNRGTVAVADAATRGQFFRTIKQWQKEHGPIYHVDFYSLENDVHDESQVIYEAEVKDEPSPAQWFRDVPAEKNPLQALREGRQLHLRVEPMLRIETDTRTGRKKQVVKNFFHISKAPSVVRTSRFQFTLFALLVVFPVIAIGLTAALYFNEKREDRIAREQYTTYILAKGRNAQLTAIQKINEDEDVRHKALQAGEQRFDQFRDQLAIQFLTDLKSPGLDLKLMDAVIETEKQPGLTDYARAERLLWLYRALGDVRYENEENRNRAARMLLKVMQTPDDIVFLGNSGVNPAMGAGHSLGYILPDVMTLKDEQVVTNGRVSPFTIQAFLTALTERSDFDLPKMKIIADTAVQNPHPNTRLQAVRILDDLLTTRFNLPEDMEQIALDALEKVAETPAFDPVSRQPKDAAEQALKELGRRAEIRDNEEESPETWVQQLTQGEEESRKVMSRVRTHWGYGDIIRALQLGPEIFQDVFLHLDETDPITLRETLQKIKEIRGLDSLDFLFMASGGQVLHLRRPERRAEARKRIADDNAVQRALEILGWNLLSEYPGHWELLTAIAEALGNPNLVHEYNYATLLFIDRMNKEAGAWEKIASDPKVVALLTRELNRFDRYMNRKDTWLSRNFPHMVHKVVAYFTAEIGSHLLNIYGGGLGVLSGDHIRGLSDLGYKRAVAVSLLYRLGYFRQMIVTGGRQIEDREFKGIQKDEKGKPIGIPVEEVLWPGTTTPMVLEVPLPDRAVKVKVWKARQGLVDILLLDTDIPENNDTDRKITEKLYRDESGRTPRIEQYDVLSVGGIMALKALGLEPDVLHLNDSHPFLAALQVIRQEMENLKESEPDRRLRFEMAMERVRQSTVFTTHTPIPAGNEKIEEWVLRPFLNQIFQPVAAELAADPNAGKDYEYMRDRILSLGMVDGQFTVTAFSLRMSSHANGVSALHGGVSRKMWKFLYPGLALSKMSIIGIVNSVHSGYHMLTGGYWQTPAITRLFHEVFRNPEIKRLMTQRDSSEFENKMKGDAWMDAAVDVKDEELWNVHVNQKKALIRELERRYLAKLKKTEAQLTPDEKKELEYIRSFDPEALTIGFARRFIDYKRANLIFKDLEHLLAIAATATMPIQIVYGGKAHPEDEKSKAIIEELHRYMQQIREKSNGKIKIVFLEEYNIASARVLEAGVDVWLNNPVRPQEASGTSGQKVMLNGGLNLSTRDGWSVEGIIDGVNGWLFGVEGDTRDDLADSEALFEVLQNKVIPLYYETGRKKWFRMMKAAVISSTYKFGMERMLGEYTETMYEPATRVHEASTVESLRQIAKDKILKREEILTVFGENKPKPYIRVEKNYPFYISLGSKISIYVVVDLKGLKPEDMGVDLLVRRSGEPIWIGMNEEVEGIGDGKYRFTATVDFPAKGKYDFSVRLAPKDQTLWHSRDERAKVSLWHAAPYSVTVEDHDVLAYRANHAFPSGRVFSIRIPAQIPVEKVYWTSANTGWSESPPEGLMERLPGNLWVLVTDKETAPPQPSDYHFGFFAHLKDGRVIWMTGEGDYEQVQVEYQRRAKVSIHPNDPLFNRDLAAKRFAELNKPPHSVDSLLEVLLREIQSEGKIYAESSSQDRAAMVMATLPAKALSDFENFDFYVHTGFQNKGHWMEIQDIPLDVQVKGDKVVLRAVFTVSKSNGHPAEYKIIAAPRGLKIVGAPTREWETKVLWSGPEFRNHHFEESAEHFTTIYQDPEHVQTSTVPVRVYPDPEHGDEEDQTRGEARSEIERLFQDIQDRAQMLSLFIDDFKRKRTDDIPSLLRTIRERYITLESKVLELESYYKDRALDTTRLDLIRSVMGKLQAETINAQSRYATRLYANLRDAAEGAQNVVEEIRQLQEFAGHINTHPHWFAHLPRDLAEEYRTWFVLFNQRLASAERILLSNIQSVKDRTAEQNEKLLKLIKERAGRLEALVKEIPRNPQYLKQMKEGIRIKSEIVEEMLESYDELAGLVTVFENSQNLAGSQLDRLAVIGIRLISIQDRILQLEVLFHFTLELLLDFHEVLDKPLTGPQRVMEYGRFVRQKEGLALVVDHLNKRKPRPAPGSNEAAALRGMNNREVSMANLVSYGNKVLERGEMRVIQGRLLGALAAGRPIQDWEARRVVPNFESVANGLVEKAAKNEFVYSYILANHLRVGGDGAAADDHVQLERKLEKFVVENAGLAVESIRNYLASDETHFFHFNQIVRFSANPSIQAWWLQFAQTAQKLSREFPGRVSADVRFLVTDQESEISKEFIGKVQAAGIGEAILLNSAAGRQINTFLSMRPNAQVYGLPEEWRRQVRRKEQHRLVDLGTLSWEESFPVATVIGFKAAKIDELTAQLLSSLAPPGSLAFNGSIPVIQAAARALVEASLSRLFASAA